MNGGTAPTRPSRCTETCWTPVPCPVCGCDLPPRGRSVPWEMNPAQCCDDNRQTDLNTRHLWSADDEERWRFYPEEAPANV